MSIQRFFRSTLLFGALAASSLTGRVRRRPAPAPGGDHGVRTAAPASGSGRGDHGGAERRAHLGQGSLGLGGRPVCLGARPLGGAPIPVRTVAHGSLAPGPARLGLGGGPLAQLTRS